MWAPRPLMVGLVLLGLTLLVAEGRIPAPVLLPVFWLWVNSHGSFPLGLVALGLLRRSAAASTVSAPCPSCGRCCGPAAASCWVPSTRSGRCC